ncbi:MAG: HAD family hydrolase [bacterium]|nr:HAD family hydrolase [bacterium]
MTRLNDIRAVLFDLDETLIRQAITFEQLALDTYAAFADALTPVTREEWWEAFWPRALDLWFMMIDGVLPASVVRQYTYINTLRALDADESLAPAMADHAERHLVESTFLFDDTVATLSGLRESGFRLGIVTNGYSEVQRAKLARHALEPLVDFVVISGEAGVHKPNTGIFEIALAHADVAPHQAVYIGDQPDVDVRGAYDAGIHPVLIAVPNPVQELPSAGLATSDMRCITRLGDILTMVAP